MACSITDAVDKDLTMGIRSYTTTAGTEDMKLWKERGRPRKSKV